MVIRGIRDQPRVSARRVGAPSEQKKTTRHILSTLFSQDDVTAGYFLEAGGYR